MKSRAKKLDKLKVRNVELADPRLNKREAQSHFMRALHVVAPQVWESLKNDVFPLCKDMFKQEGPFPKPLLKWAKDYHLDECENDWIKTRAIIDMISWHSGHGAPKQIFYGLMRLKGQEFSTEPFDPGHYGSYDLENETRTIFYDRSLALFNERIKTYMDSIEKKANNAKRQKVPAYIKINIDGIDLIRNFVIFIQYQVNGCNRNWIANKYNLSLYNVHKIIDRVSSIVGIEARKDTPGRPRKQ